MKVALAYQLARNMGFRYISFRAGYEIKKRVGWFKKEYPIAPKTMFFLSLADWRKLDTPFVFSDRASIETKKSKRESLKLDADRILNYEVPFFSAKWINLGVDYDWITNVETGYRYDIDKHWSEINDFSLESGDIKYVWEKSRFSYLLILMRYDYHFDEDHSEFVFKEINSWIDFNPVNQGPNWKCSQEISLRLFNWMYCLCFYKNSPFLTEALWIKIQNVIYWQLDHVYRNINFSRIAVRNNHALTETLALTLFEILLPFIPETKKWGREGRKYFEQEINYQVYEDGAFIQHSMNYHRVLVQLLSFGLVVTQKANKPFSKHVYQKSQLTLNFLYQFLQPENGNLPNYGANDGALFFPLSQHEFRDYRPQLNSLHKILYGKDLFSGFEEDFYFGSAETPYLFEKLQQNRGFTTFDKSGYYIIRTEELFVFIKCSSYKDRPSHADNLHIDIWKNGINVFRDAGSYKYNTEIEWSTFFFGTQSHNTVMIDNCDQMLKGNRFIWFYWTKALEVAITDEENQYCFEGAIKAFSYLDKSILHTRKIAVSKNNNEIIVNDEILNIGNRTATQIWNCNPECKIEIEAIIDNKERIPEHYKSYYSSLYGQKQDQLGVRFRFENEIKTTIILK